MPLTFASPPADAGAALQVGLRAVAEGQRSDPRGGGPLALAAAPLVLKPHPLYSLGLSELAGGKGIEDAQLVAWRYLIVENQQVRQAAEVVHDPAGGSRFASLTTGFVAGAEQAFALADSLPEVIGGNYEIRALQVPALYVMALWLKDQTGTQDRFILLPRVFPPFQALRPYTAEELLPLLKQQAVARTALDQQVNGGIPIMPQNPRP